MKTRWLLSLLAGCAAVLGGASVSALAADAAGGAEAIARGEAAFTHRCAMCHRAGQTGTFILARRLGEDRSLLEQRTDLVDVYIRQVVRQGLVNMPRISRVELPDADLDAVIAYLNRPQSLRGASPSQR
ncbi:MAG: cytochrome c [Nevskiaceae bacterium]|jgi:mono/diheme cytochrome c family protein|nr:cytochrome c [Nevskiaceae bacterium]